MRVFLAISVLILSTFANTLALAQGFGTTNRSLNDSAAQPEFLSVEEAYRLDIDITDDQQLHLHWEIADNYYLYQHRFKFEMTDDAGEVALQADIPPALEKFDEYFGQVQVYYQSADVPLRLTRPSSAATLTVTSQGCADAGLCYPPHKQYFVVNFEQKTVLATGKPEAKPTTAQVDTLTKGQAPASTQSATGSLAYMLLLAFLGGAILNLMPCVFPILSLKVLSFARSTDEDRHLQSWVYTAGVITSFVAVAAVLIALQQAGAAIGWGFQLQSPGFVIALAYLFVAMGLSLSGVVEFGGAFMNTGSQLADRGGLSGSFFTGVLAVVVASPCTAPFMGTALGFAVSQPAHIGLLVFAALGAGMAAPLLLFSYSKAARSLMPKPGPWMETLKEFLAFPLYATALWLLWVAGRQTGINTMTAALSGTLLLAMGLWIWNHQAWRKAIALICVIGAIGLASVRGIDPEVSAGNVSQGKLAWSNEDVAALRAEGQPVFVDVTADWCITCKVNEATVLLTEDITAAFAQHGVVYMIADWTNHNAEIAQLLERYGRTGIPLYIMYPADSEQEPMILPQILTKGIVLDALSAVSPTKAAIAGSF